MNHVTEQTASPADEFSHIIPKAKVLNRSDVLRKACMGKRVIHIGFVDQGRMKARLARRQWLHGQLAEVASELVGADLDEAGVKAAQEIGYEAYVLDCQDALAVSALRLKPADVVIAGELIEHLNNPGLFLQAVKPLLGPGGVLVITTPNATRITNAIGSLANREFVNDDHVSWFSWHTMSTLLQRHGWRIETFAYYMIPPSEVDHAWSYGARAQLHAANMFRRSATLVARARPAISDGLIVAATAES